MGTKTGRPTPRDTALAVGLAMVEVMKAAKLPGLVSVDVAGSVRRGKDVVSDIDFVVAADIDDLTVWNEPWKAMTVTGVGIKWTPKGGAGDFGDVRIEFYKAPTTRHVGATLLFTTGPASLNVYMRKQAIARGWKLSQYGLLTATGERIDVPTGDDAEEDEGRIFDALEMPRMTAEQREDWARVVKHARH